MWGNSLVIWMGMAGSCRPGSTWGEAFGMLTLSLKHNKHGAPASLVGHINWTWIIFNISRITRCYRVIWVLAAIGSYRCLDTNSGAWARLLRSLRVSAIHHRKHHSTVAIPQRMTDPPVAPHRGVACNDPSATWVQVQIEAKKYAWMDNRIHVINTRLSQTNRFISQPQDEQTYLNISQWPMP